MKKSFSGIKPEVENQNLVLNGIAPENGQLVPSAQDPLILNGPSSKKEASAKKTKKTASYRRKGESDSFGKIDHGSSPPMKKIWHRVKKRREEENLSIEVCAKKMKISVKEARRQEDPYSDLLLSQLAAWEKVLDMDTLLLLGDDPIRDPFEDREFLLRIIKYVKTLYTVLNELKEMAREDHEDWEDPEYRVYRVYLMRILRILKSMMDMILEKIPELKDVSALPEVGKSHEAKDGAASYRRFNPGNPSSPYKSDPE